MLILMRSIGESIKIGRNITVMVAGITGTKVKLGITAPKDIRVDREEVADRIKKNKGAA